ncbi:hypothetical protein QIT50_gp30 [Pyrobaculum spherical virus 2]|uniref:Uncharacterized protein n=1 Tax=Pyrobaculum spherical virus 2 TaxID=2730632 RepID=A0A6M3VYY9_9VIRU|nr:hypothetical protein QIT50_gp30 [Pyrobaculum spherical virus 2]QJF12442.1 hypothetical protein PSV2_gp30 [Pyrobaculum spherical virus 2]
MINNTNYVVVGGVKIWRIGDKYLIEKKRSYFARLYKSVLDIVSEKPVTSNYIVKTANVHKHVLYTLEGLIHKFDMGAFFVWYKDPIASISQLLKLGYYPKDYTLKLVHTIAKHICNCDAKSHTFSVSVKTLRNIYNLNAHHRIIGHILLKLTEEIGGQPIPRRNGYVYVFDKYKVSAWCAKTW